MPKNEMDLSRRSGLRNPTRDINSMPRGIGHLFEEFLGDLAPTWNRSQVTDFDFNPAVDVEESEDHYLITADLPGVKKDDVHVEMSDNQLIIWGDRNEQKREVGKNRYFEERAYGRFQRSFSLPSNIQAEQVEADYQDGVLRIALPKAEVAKKRQIQIGNKSEGLLSRIVGRRKDDKKDVEVKSKTSAA